MNKNLPESVQKFVDLSEQLQGVTDRNQVTYMYGVRIAVSDVHALVEYLNSVRADCKDFQCQQVHDYMDSLAKSLGIEVDAGLLSVIKATIIQQEISRLQNKSGWQPIATAPSDGCQALAWDSVNKTPVICACPVGPSGFNERYTHWRPLLEPPQQQARTSTIPEEIKAVESESEIDWASYKLTRDSFVSKQSAYDPVKQKWSDHIGPWPSGYQVAAEHVGWLSFCEGVEYGKQLKP